jgi:hypothetical protein
MCKELAEDAITSGKANSSFDETWKLDYSIYRWLCEIKHTTLRVASLDSGSVSTKDGYVIMAAPDRRDEYAGMKKLLCIFSLMETRVAIESFAKVTGVGNEASDEKKFRSILKDVDDFETVQITDKASLKIPFGLKDTIWGQKNLRPLKCFKKGHDS